MSVKNNNISVVYKLYARDTEEEKEELVEECNEQQPLRFISNMGCMLKPFEAALQDLEAGADFDFTIPCADAYGEFNEDMMFDVPREKFLGPDGKLDENYIYDGSVIMLRDADGQQYNATIIEVKDDAVTVDLNHPHAGEDLHFVGRVLENREATADEITQLIQTLSGEGQCSGHCGGCGGHCEGEGGCGGCH